MSNQLMLPFLHLIGVEEGHGIPPFCHYFQTKDDLRVVVDIFPSNISVRTSKTEGRDISVESNSNGNRGYGYNVKFNENKDIEFTTETI